MTKQELMAYSRNICTIRTDRCSRLGARAIANWILNWNGERQHLVATRPNCRFVCRRRFNEEGGLQHTVTATGKMVWSGPRDSLTPHSMEIVSYSFRDHDCACLCNNNHTIGFVVICCLFFPSSFWTKTSWVYYEIIFMWTERPNEVVFKGRGILCSIYWEQTNSFRFCGMCLCLRACLRGRVCLCCFFLLFFSSIVARSLFVRLPCARVNHYDVVNLFINRQSKHSFNFAMPTIYSRPPKRATN